MDILGQMKPCKLHMLGCLPKASPRNKQQSVGFGICRRLWNECGEDMGGIQLAGDEKVMRSFRRLDELERGHGGDGDPHF